LKRPETTNLPLPIVSQGCLAAFGNWYWAPTCPYRYMAQSPPHSERYSYSTADDTKQSWDSRSSQLYKDHTHLNCIDVSLPEAHTTRCLLCFGSPISFDQELGDCSAAVNSTDPPCSVREGPFQVHSPISLSRKLQTALRSKSVFVLTYP
jgi:hypothetical protein